MPTIRSKNVVNPCFTVGYTINKDMRTDDETDSLDAAYAPYNVAIPGGQVASYWNDWGNDIFDGWGFFYLFNLLEIFDFQKVAAQVVNVATGTYFFPQLSPQNLANGKFTTQTFEAFGKIFTIRDLQI